MAQIALPRQQAAQAASSGVGSPLYQRRRPSNTGPIELIPNPEFSFPMRAPELSSSAPSSATNARPMSLQGLPNARRGSAPHLRQKSVSALPDFSFNPAGTSQASAPSTSPPHTPSTLVRPIGHKRGASEFIGGDGRAGPSTLLSSSPTKVDGFLPGPSGTLRPGPPAGRRGHAHRRSGAISSHELSAIMRPAEQNAASRGGSAPVTPLEGEQFVFGHSVNKSISQPSLRDTGLFNDDSDSSPRRPPSRARVGFSDKIEYIRPLSTISSETETSLSTVRGHSATGSLSSIISAGTSTPPSVRLGRQSLSPPLEIEGRPSTAGAILDMAGKNNFEFGDELASRKRPMSAVSPASPVKVASPTSARAITTKRRGLFRLEPRRSDATVPSLLSSASDPALSASLPSPLPSPMHEDDDEVAESDKLKSAARKISKKPRKVKSWANSIISRKGKDSKKNLAMTPTPLGPAADSEDSSDSDGTGVDFDVDNTVTIVSPTEESIPIRKATPEISAWKPRELKRTDSDSMHPVIDLDAALGPFNTPQGPSTRAQQRGFAAHRRAMHSAGGMLQSHRRTESAPELVPFEFRSAAAKPSPAMADVFEEEEPEEDDQQSQADVARSGSVQEDMQEEVEELKIQLVESEDSCEGPAIKWNFDDGLGIKRPESTRQKAVDEAIPSPRTLQPTTSNDSDHAMDMSPIEVVEDYEEPRTSSLTHSSDSTVTPQLTGESKDPQPVMNLPLPLPQQSLMTPDTFTSSFSSPDFRSSQASLDTPRLGTAASSVTDYRAMPSPSFGEPGPEVRISVDDVPSLISSRSTYSAMQNGCPALNQRRAGERSTSLCSANSEVDQRRRKRSSIASLSRLINTSSFGERSKLSIEQRPQSEYLEPTKETKKKHRRLSKLKFWKPKESSEQK